METCPSGCKKSRTNKRIRSKKLQNWFYLKKILIMYIMLIMTYVVMRVT